jgi:hypothetical protein
VTGSDFVEATSSVVVATGVVRVRPTTLFLVFNTTSVAGFTVIDGVGVEFTSW